MDYLKMLKAESVAQLEANWTEQLPLKGTGRERDYQPVAKVFNPAGSGTWLLSEKEPDSSLAYGLCDLGHGTPELGYVCLEELYSVRLLGGLRMEQDLWWKPAKTLSEYATEARQLGYVRA